MNLSIIVGPLVGAVIGYCTNYIAVKMLFRPLEAKYIFGKRIPFTPGIIPKSKDRIAKAIGSAVGDSLLTQEALEKSLLSEDIKTKLEDKINSKVDEMSSDTRSIHEAITFYVDEEQFHDTLGSGEELVSRKLCEKIEEMDIGTMVASEVIKAIKSNLGFLSKIIGDDMINSLAAPISAGVDKMIEEDGMDIIQGKIHEEFDSFQWKTVGQVVTSITESGVNLGTLTSKAYTILIEKKLGAMLKGINITQIVQEKIDSMEMEEVEELVLSVMNKELNAIVNLGALIGFVLGCVNIFI